MSACTLPSLFKGAPIVPSAPEAQEDDSTKRDNFGCDLVPPNEVWEGDRRPDCRDTAQLSRPPSTTRHASIAAKSVVLNAPLLASSPHTVGSNINGAGGGGGGGLASPQNHSRTCGRNGLSDAIEVTLSVSQSGRTCEATRTLARIIDLATDLVAEFKTDGGDVGSLAVSIPDLSPEVASAALAPFGSFTHLCGRLGTVRVLLSNWFAEVGAAMDAAMTPGGSSLALVSFLWEPLWLTDGSATAGLGGLRSLPNRSPRDGERPGPGRK